MAAITWTERGCLLLLPPGVHSRFGGHLIPRLARGLGGEAQTQITTTGIVCRIAVATAPLIAGR